MLAGLQTMVIGTNANSLCLTCMCENKVLKLLHKLHITTHSYKISTATENHAHSIKQIQTTALLSSRLKSLYSCLQAQDEKMLVFVTNPAKGLEKLSLYESHQTLY
jgi:hypothetical protein|uniref:Uncharacterized protein n=1 Tax=Zea mays TaxID=4577 RepID=A0A804LZD1_MAIZE